MHLLLQRTISRMKDLLRRPLPNFESYARCVRGKAGLEIGGPSDLFRNRRFLPLYNRAGSLDNCNFASSTVWGDHAADFRFSALRPPGKTIVCDGSRLDPVPTASYDFLLSSHNLEHFANPLKALREWHRVLRPGGALILVLPYYRDTFDHRRTPTPLEAMLADEERGTQEDDLSHLEEILANHDLSRDPGSTSFEHFRARSLDNFNNRCLHHHVFDEHNSRALLTAAEFTVLAVDIQRPGNLCLLAQR